MNTNLLALITTLLTTNVTETVTKWEHLERNYNNSILPNYAEGGIIRGPEEKYGPLEKLVTTTVSKVTRLNYEWPAGVPRINEVSEVLTNYYRVFKLEKTEVWKDVGLVEMGGNILTTNSIIWHGLTLTNSTVKWAIDSDVPLRLIAP